VIAQSNSGDCPVKERTGTRTATKSSAATTSTRGIVPLRDVNVAKGVTDISPSSIYNGIVETLKRVDFQAGSIRGGRMRRRRGGW